MKTIQSQFKNDDLNELLLQLDEHLTAIDLLLPKLESHVVDNGTGSQGDLHDRASIKLHKMIRKMLKFSNDNWTSTYKNIT